MLIQYCDGCGVRIAEAEVTSGAARQVDENRYLCGKCWTAKNPAPAAAPAQGTRIISPPAGSRHPAAGAATSRSGVRPVSETTRTRAAASSSAKRSQSNLAIWLSAGGGLLLLLGVALMMKSGAGKSSGLAEEKKGAEKKAEAPKALPKETAKTGSITNMSAIAGQVQTPAKNPDPPPAEPRKGGGLLGMLVDKAPNESADQWRITYAARLLDEAVKFSKEHPEDVWMYRLRLTKIAENHTSSPAGKDAARKLAELKPPEGGTWPEGWVWHEIWHNIGGGKVADLTNHASFSGNPSAKSKLTELMTQVEFADNYGSRIRGFLHPPCDGQYTLWVATDDDGELWLSSDESEQSKKKIAETTYSDPQQWDRHPTQKSAPVTLQRGKKYYFEILQKEAGGGDHAAAGWQLPNGQMERPISGARISPFQP